MAYWLRETERLLAQSQGEESHLLFVKHKLLWSYQDLSLFRDDQPPWQPTPVDRRAAALLKTLFDE